MAGGNNGMMVGHGQMPAANQYAAYMNLQHQHQHQHQHQQMNYNPRAQGGGVTMQGIPHYNNQQDPGMGAMQANDMNVSIPGSSGMQGPRSVPSMQSAINIQENVRNVWRWNLEEQMAVLRDVVERYKFISLDCKFPGIVTRPIGTFKTTSEYHYQTLRSNVDLLQVVQVGLSFADEFGNRPLGVGTWQFNFKFSIKDDMCSTDGLDLLRQAGVVFDMNEVEGIDVFAFGELLISSGLVLDDSINWITYHSGYDLGYLLSVMLNDKLPVEEAGYLKALSVYFPTVWDVKHIVRMFHTSPKSTLAEIADELNIRSNTNTNGGNRVSSSGNEAILNCAVFFELRRIIPEIGKAQGGLFGLGDGLKASTAAEQLAAEEAKKRTGTGVTKLTNVFQYGKMGGI